MEAGDLSASVPAVSGDIGVEGAMPSVGVDAPSVGVDVPSTSASVGVAGERLQGGRDTFQGQTLLLKL